MAKKEDEDKIASTALPVGVLDYLAGLVPFDVTSPSFTNSDYVDDRMVPFSANRVHNNRRDSIGLDKPKHGTIVKVLEEIPSDTANYDTSTWTGYRPGNHTVGFYRVRVQTVHDESLPVPDARDPASPRTQRRANNFPKAVFLNQSGVLTIGTNVLVRPLDANREFWEIVKVLGNPAADTLSTLPPPSAKSAHAKGSSQPAGSGTGVPPKVPAKVPAPKIVVDPSKARKKPCPDISTKSKLEESAAKLGIDPTTLLTIARVEGGRPSALRFEPHLFLRKVPGAAIDYTPGSDFCPEKRNGKCIDTVSYVGSETNRSAFEKAYAIDPQAAIRSTSFGSFQVIPAGNLEHLSEDPQAFLDRFDNEPESLSYDMLEAFIEADPRLVEAAENQDWRTFARIYNGPKADEQGYPEKFAATYDYAKNQGCFPETSPLAVAENGEDPFGTSPLSDEETG